MQAAQNAADRAIYAIDQALKVVAPPPPPPPPPPVQCPDGTTVPAGQTCPPPVVCPDGTVIKAGADCPTPAPFGNWIAAPLRVGGYAFLANQGTCCKGAIFHINRTAMSNDADPTKRQLIYYGYFVQDETGNFPATNPFWKNYEFGGWQAKDLFGIEPLAIPPATGMRPTYGDTVVALQACVGRSVPDALTVGTRYKVMGLTVDLPVGGNSSQTDLPTGAHLNPEVDDGLHRGDGWWSLSVPLSCVQKV